ncbi:MAG: hypothetical protein BRC41_07470 [Cyanobacteria bacterium QH_9_48_43]|nr:MAG: hypothetical protein BRC41_07470 [Cyanobacteria bacterium QH_9_48_43]
MDQMWSFVGSKANQKWIGLAMDKATREIVGLYVGDRSRAGAWGLWQSLPAVYRQGAACYTDFWEASLLPRKRHRTVGKNSGLA